MKNKDIKYYARAANMEEGQKRYFKTMGDGFIYEWDPDNREWHIYNTLSEWNLSGLYVTPLSSAEIFTELL